MASKGEITRAKILDGAKRLVMTQGFAGTSIAAIASELGLTKQALLHHFGSARAVA